MPYGYVRPSWNSSFTQSSHLGSYSALQDKHCLFTKGEGFRRYFESVVGPLGVQALGMVKPNMDLDYSKLSTQRRLGLNTRPGGGGRGGLGEGLVGGLK